MAVPKAEGVMKHTITLTDKEIVTLRNALYYASEWERSVIDTCLVKDYSTGTWRPMRGQARTVAGCKKNIARWDKLSGKLSTTTRT